MLRYTTQNSTSSWGLLILRVLVSIALLTHGYPKLMKLLAGPPYEFADPIGLGVTFSLILTVFAEFICPLLIILGLWTRWATLPVIITFLIIILKVHAGEPFQEVELAFFYLVSYVCLLFTGPGKFSLEGWKYK